MDAPYDDSQAEVLNLDRGISRDGKQRPCRFPYCFEDKRSSPNPLDPRGVRMRSQCVFLSKQSDYCIGNLRSR